MQPLPPLPPASLCCSGSLPREMVETSPCSKSLLLLVCFQQVSLFRAAVHVPLVQLQVQGWPCPDPKENVSPNSWRRAACRSSFLGQSGERLAAALPGASEAPAGLSSLSPGAWTREKDTH